MSISSTFVGDSGPNEQWDAYNQLDQVIRLLSHRPAAPAGKEVVPNVHFTKKDAKIFSVGGRGRACSDWRVERRRARDVFDRYEVELDPSAQVGRTSPALLAMVRAACELREHRSWSRGAAGVLALDEPTAFLTEHEKVFLFDLIRRITAEGFGALFVSHDMTAVREISHRAATLAAGNAQHHEILDAIERGDGDEAEQLARDHAALAIRNLEAVLESGDLERLPASGLISLQGGWPGPAAPGINHPVQGESGR